MLHRHRTLLRLTHHHTRTRTTSTLLDDRSELQTSHAHCSVAIVGRPNVGKSTLFNRLTLGNRKALVSPVAGTTRDTSYGQCSWREHEFSVIDTGGILYAKSIALQADVTRMAAAAIEEADVIVLLLDYRDGVTGVDRQVARQLRQANKPVLLLVNKADGSSDRDGNFLFDETLAALTDGNVRERVGEYERLGVGLPTFVSAMHDGGLQDALERIGEHVAAYDRERGIAPARSTPKKERGNSKGRKGVVPEPLIRIAIIGQPNVGKSSLLNRALRTERAVVSPIAGTTNDPVDEEVELFGRKVLLVDTAGVRRRATGDNADEANLEKRAALWAMRAVARCHVAILMVDPRIGRGIGEQEQRLAGALEERRCSVVIAANKWDLVRNDKQVNKKSLSEEVQKQLGFLPYAPVVPISAKTGYNVDKVLETAIQCFDERSFRFSTPQINRLIRDAHTLHQPPSKRGRRLKVSYVTQSAQYPPTFVLWCNDPSLAHYSYQRFLENRIREAHPYVGTPLSFVFRKK